MSNSNNQNEIYRIRRDKVFSSYGSFNKMSEEFNNQTTNNFIDNLIKQLYEKEKIVYEKMGLKNILPSPLTLNKKRISIWSRGLTNLIENRMKGQKNNSDVNNNRQKWFNFYELLGNKETYLRLADLQHASFHRSEVIEYIKNKIELNLDDQMRNSKPSRQDILRKAITTDEDLFKNLYNNFFSEFRKAFFNLDENLDFSPRRKTFFTLNIEDLVKKGKNTFKKEMNSFFLNTFWDIIKESKKRNLQIEIDFDKMKTSAINAYKNIINNIIMRNEDSKYKKTIFRQIKEDLIKRVETNFQSSFKKGYFNFYGFDIKNNKGNIYLIQQIPLDNFISDPSTRKTSNPGMSKLKVFKKIGDTIVNTKSNKDIVFDHFYNNFVNLLFNNIKEKDRESYPNSIEIIKFLISVLKLDSLSINELNKFLQDYGEQKLNKNDFSVFNKEIPKQIYNGFSLYVQYTNQGVSGILGEIRGAIAAKYGISIGGDVKILGSEIAKSGQYAVDVALLNGEDTIYEMQIKNYITSDKNIKLYDSKISLAQEKYLNRYFQKDFVEKLQTFLINFILYTEKQNHRNSNLSRDSDESNKMKDTVNNVLKYQMVKNTHNFLRMHQEDLENINAWNVFFLVNQIYYPASYVLRLLEINIEEQEGEINNFYQINGNNGLFFHKYGDENIKDDEKFKGNTNILSKNIIKFTGVTIPISRLT